MINRDKFNKYEQLFIEQNHKVNLISKNDEKYLWEKHIYDSLSISNFFDKYGMPQEMLDIGTGGGFPAVPVAIAYPQIKIHALDSITKKIRAVQIFKEELGLKNLEPICMRAENYNKKFDLITSRAVSSLKNICAYALPKLNKNGYFIAYKSRKINEEKEESKEILTKFHAKVIDIIKYDLPLEESYERFLIVIKRY